MNYYDQKQLIAAVDKNDQVTGKIEKWAAHKKGLLHRGFTVGLFYQNNIILQHRKHPVFDGYFDLTCSSHPVFRNGQLQDAIDAVYEALKREWNLEKSDLLPQVKNCGFVYYRTHDLKSGFLEHEICHLFISTATTLPSPDFKYAYGFSLLPQSKLTSSRLPFAPWVKKLISLL